MGGSQAVWHCLSAAIATRLRRSKFTFLRSECSHTIKLICPIPISTHFSTSHSIRSAFFVGATAKCSRKLPRRRSSLSSPNSTMQAFGLSAMIVAGAMWPLPSVSQTSSPARWRKARTQCSDSSALNVTTDDVRSG